MKLALLAAVALVAAPMMDASAHIPEVESQRLCSSWGR